MKKVKFIRHLIGVIILCFITSTSFAQDIQRNIAIKLYSSFGWSSLQNTSSFNPATQSSLFQKNKNFYLGPVSPAISLYRPNGDFHETGITQLSFNRASREVTELDSLNNIIQISDGRITTEARVQLRYEYNFLLRRKKLDAKLKPYIGVSASPYFSHRKFEPLVSNGFPSSSTFLGASIALTSRVTYDFGERWFADVNFRYTFANASISTGKFENPNLPEQQQRITRLDTELFSGRSFPFRIGVGFRL